VTTFRVRLSSEVRDAHFQVTIQTIWPPTTHVDRALRSIVERHLLQVARSAAKNYSVLDPDEARMAIDLKLSCDLRPEDVDICPAGANIISLEVGPDDRHMAESQQAFHRMTALAQAERLEEVNRLRILGDTVLANPALARLWWLEGKPGKLKELVELDNKKVFQDVAELFSPQAERLAVDPIAELIRIFLQDLDSQCRELLIGQVRIVFHSYERDDLVDRLDSCRDPSATPSSDNGSNGDFFRRVSADQKRTGDAAQPPP
jgi:hypothetical protein